MALDDASIEPTLIEPGIEDSVAPRTWYVTPPDLMRWMSEHERDSAIVLLDVEPDVLATGEVRIDLRVAFKYVTVRRKGLLAHADFYIGCTSASLQLSTADHSIVSHTPSTELTINYNDIERRTRSSRALIEPTLQWQSSTHKGEARPGALSLEAGSESVFERSFAYTERFLAAVHTGNSVTWRLDPPTRMQAVRDFLFCNLHVHAVLDSGASPCRGQVSVRPSDLRFFDPERRPYAKVTSFFLLYALFKARRSIHRPEGITVAFAEDAP